ncbi:MAG: galactose oxidase [Sphingobacteriales bacterium]|nr:MAG: galactose oxidase [Sphingobacteriales bacterium]
MRTIVGAILIIMMIQVDACVQPSKDEAKWDSLSPIPDSVGFAGSFAGVSNGVLIVAGGANFPDGGAPWTGSVKRWSNRIFVLESPEAEWRPGGLLPDSLGYGGSVSCNNELILIGGSNENGHSTAVIALQWQGDTVSNRRLPDLPKPMANFSSVLLANHIYVAGGISKADAQQAEANFWRLNLENTEKGWEVLESWPGAPRMLAVLGVYDNKVYVFSGVELVNGQRNYLKDGFSFDPSAGWTRIADLPVSVAAAASPALSTSAGLAVVGGDDGKLAPRASALKDKHPGFSNDMLAYSVAEDRWSSSGQVRIGASADARARIPVTTTAVVWNNLYVLPGGEVRPAIRTNHVLAYTFLNQK